MLFLVLVLLAYLIGSVPTSFILGKVLRGIDLREHGSRNIGATNAMRVLGKPAGSAVLILDAAKGFFPTLLFPLINKENVFGFLSPANQGLCIGLAAVVGHIFTVFLRFRGGKGVATGIGVYLALAPKALLLTFGICLILVAGTRYVSLGSLTGAVVLPIFLLLVGPRSLPLVILTVLIGALVIWRHRENIKRLLRGTESKIF
jgi:glycerol-3-phosphate acyltransferase PlsY